MIEGFKPRHYRFKGANTSNERRFFWLAWLIGIVFLIIVIKYF